MIVGLLVEQSKTACERGDRIIGGVSDVFCFF